ncbi:hypothetical protein [Lutibacter sp.]|uniref:DUF6943 family protein n=1 Tax=Lutibacter sp. TaxID=1925666 RepID=UPI003564CB2B
MSNFEIKTHQPGRTYNKPHFFILNKGLNSGKPMRKPCPNCFVIKAATEEQIQTLFYMCLSLKIGRYFEYYLKGSVIPFITINDCFKVLKNAYFNQKNNADALEKHIQILNQIQQREENLKQSLEAVKNLKVAFIQSYFRDNSKRG